MQPLIGNRYSVFGIRYSVTGVRCRISLTISTKAGEFKNLGINP